MTVRSCGLAIPHPFWQPRRNFPGILSRPLVCPSGLCHQCVPPSGEWKWPGPHIDHAIKEHLHKTFPRAFRIATMTFLSDVPPHGGGTVVWPGSHAVLERLAKSDPERFEMMWTLNQEVPHVTLADPVELTPKRGDVLFYSYLCAHAGSQNTSDRPRLALNAKWSDVNRDARTVCFVPLANGKGWTDFDNPRVAPYEGSDYTVEAQHTKTPPSLGAPRSSLL